MPRDDDHDQREVSDEDPEASGGDAEAAGSVSERESVAQDDDELFTSEDADED